MKKPDGTIDLIGSSVQLGLGIVDLVKEFAPGPEVRAERRKKRKIKVAIRQLKGRFKKVALETYVKVNFAEYTQTEQTEIINYIKPLLP